MENPPSNNAIQQKDVQEGMCYNVPSAESAEWENRGIQVQITTRCKVIMPGIHSTPRISQTLTPARRQANHKNRANILTQRRVQEKKKKGERQTSCMSVYVHKSST